MRTLKVGPWLYIVGLMTAEQDMKLNEKGKNLVQDRLEQALDLQAEGGWDRLTDDQVALLLVAVRTDWLKRGRRW